MIPKAVPNIFFLTIIEALESTQFAYILRPRPSIEKAKKMNTLGVYYVAKKRISWTPKNRKAPNIEMYLRIPILSTNIPEGILSNAAEKYVHIMTSPASSSENPNLVCSSPLAPSKNGTYIPKFMVHIRVSIQNEYLSSFKSLILIYSLWVYC